jgi:ATP-dependent RNA helicase DeaD
LASDETHRIEGTFADLGVPKEILVGLNTMSYDGPTPVQSACWVPASAGHDLVVQSKTGSGKTTGFCLPVLAQLLDAPRRPKQPYALMLAPTRELCAQIYRELKGLTEGIADFEVTPIYGGTAFEPQIDALNRGTQILVATPGRLIDHLRRGNIDLSKCRHAVLDEADEMLSMGFWEEVTNILKKFPNERQILLYSATLPPRIERAAKTFMSDVQRVDLGGESRTVEGVDHFLYRTDKSVGMTRNLLRMLETIAPTNAIIFCNRKDEVDVVCAFLRRQLWDCMPIHGDMTQAKREQALAKVREGRSKLLVATDVAARGIDIRDLDAVLATEFSRDAEIYVHRSGRTGRIGRSGTAATLLTATGQVQRRTVTQRYKVQFKEVDMPDNDEAIDKQAERVIADLTSASAGFPLEQYMQLAQKITDSPDGVQAVAYLMFQHTKKQTAANTASEDDRRGGGGGRGGSGGGGRGGRR